jgi:uncharacterized C2H2 Zn-finger protein
LIEKQELLQELLETQNQRECDFAQDLIEEYLEEDESSTIEEEPNEICIAIPSLRNVQDRSNTSAVIKLIEEIEQNNEIILECSKIRKKRKSRPLAESQAARREELRFEKPMLKLVMQPAHPEVSFSSEKEYKVCGPKFISNFRLEQHPVPNLPTCCDQVFEQMNDYKKHQSSVHPVLIECEQCGKKLKSKKTYLVHKRSHQDVRRFKCSHPICFKAFNFKLHLENHERTHSGEKPFKCSICSASFKQSYQLTVHSRKHNASIKCSACKLKFSLKTQLENHQCGSSEQKVMNTGKKGSAEL